MKLAQIMTVVFVACILVSAIPASAATMNYKLGVQSGTTSDTYAAAELANAEVSAFGLPQKFQRLDRLRVP